MYKRLICLIVVLNAVGLLGCAGARGTVELENLKYPASMSAFLYGPQNETLVKNKELKVVDNFGYEKTFWGVLYSIVPLSGSTDIGDAINKKIEAAGGDGIINLSVTTTSCALNDFYYAFLLNLLPIFPGCANVVVEGEVVKFVPQQTRYSP